MAGIGNPSSLMEKPWNPWIFVYYIQLNQETGLLHISKQGYEAINIHKLGGLV